MHIEIFALCDAATGDFGKLSMLGAFDTIWTTKTPVVHPQSALALRIRFERIERGEHQVAVNFIDMDGKNVIPQAQGSITINFPDDQRSGSANLILNIQGLKLDQFGEYSIDLAVDGQQRASLPFFVRERK